jgi:hypothetical protein
MDSLTISPAQKFAKFTANRPVSWEIEPQPLGKLNVGDQESAQGDSAADDLVFGRAAHRGGRR